MRKAPHIVVVGSSNIDLPTFTNRIPSPGETIFGHSFQLGFGGKGANQAVAARLCGADVSMLARLGDDLFAHPTLENFASHGIDTQHVLTTPGISSGVAPIFVDSSGQNSILVIKGANEKLSPADIENAASLLLHADLIVLQLEIPLDTVDFTLRFARQHGIPSILNPAPAQSLDDAQIAQADYLIPNESEAASLTGLPVSNVEEAQACAQRLHEKGVKNVIITLGSNGALLANASGVQHVPPFPVKAVDTSGAGDAFIGSFAFFLSNGHPELDSLHRASLYAALSTLRTGTQRSFVTREHFEAEWNQRDHSAPLPHPPQPR